MISQFHGMTLSKFYLYQRLLLILRYFIDVLRDTYPFSNVARVYSTIAWTDMTNVAKEAFTLLAANRNSQSSE